MTLRMVHIGILSTCLGLHLDGQSAFGGELSKSFSSGNFLGRGNTGVAVAEGEDALFFNPAGLASQFRKFPNPVALAPSLEFSASTNEIYEQVANQGKALAEALNDRVGDNQHVGLNLFSGGFLGGLGFGAYAHSSNNLIIAKDPSAGALEHVLIDLQTDTGAVLGYGLGLFKGLVKFGGSVRYINRSQGFVDANAVEAEGLKKTSVDDFTVTGSGVALDAGIIFGREQGRGFNIGIHLRNIGGTSFTQEERDDIETPGARDVIQEDPQMVDVGLAFTPMARYRLFRFLVDMRDAANASATSPYRRLHLGLEAQVRRGIGITSGLNQGYGTAGLWWQTQFFRADAGTYGEEIGEYVGHREDRRYFIRLNVGF